MVAYKKKIQTYNIQPSPPWKSQIAHLDMHRLVFGINFQIHYTTLFHHKYGMVVEKQAINKTRKIHLTIILWQSTNAKQLTESVSLTILVSIHLLIHFSTHLCYYSHSRHPSLLHSFTPGSKPTFSTNPSHRRFLSPTGLPHDNGTGPDLSRSSLCFLFHILIFCLFRVVD